MTKDPGRLDVLSEGNLRGTGAASAHRPREKLTGNMTRLVEQRALAGTQGKKESL